MTTRRLAYWWFRFVISGRFLETFLDLPRAQDLSRPASNAAQNNDHMSSGHDLPRHGPAKSNAGRSKEVALT